MRVSPTVVQVEVSVNYRRTLVQMRDAAKQKAGCSNQITDANFPIDSSWTYVRDFFLVDFHRLVKDSEVPILSEILWELDQLGLQPEGPAELCALAEAYPELQKKVNIVARRQLWRSHEGTMVCPMLHTFEDSDNVHAIGPLGYRVDGRGNPLSFVSGIGLVNVNWGWDPLIPYQFLTSLKRK